MIKNDFEYLNKFFIDKNGDKREKVLEIYYDKIGKDENVVKIEFQNIEVLERGEFYDEEIGVASINAEFGLAYEKTVVIKEDKRRRFQTEDIDNYKDVKKILYIVGYIEREDEEDYEFTYEDNYLRVNDEDLKEIKEKVRQINEKYGIYCRVPKNEVYYYVDDLGVIQQVRDYRFEKDDKRYNIGNYFVTKDRAIVYLKQLLIFNQGNSNLFFQKEYWENDEDDEESK
jgi:putative uncharacterized protein FNV0866